MVRLGGSVKYCPSIAGHIEPGRVQGVHADVVPVVLRLLQRVAGSEAVEVDGVAGHHPHLAPVSQPEVFLVVLLVVQQCPDHHLPLHLQRHDLEGGEAVELRECLHLQLRVTAGQRLYGRDLGLVSFSVGEGGAPAM